MTRILSLLDQRHLVEQVVHNRLDLVEVAVERIDNGPLIEERYVVSSASTVQVTIKDLSTGFSITCDLGA